MLNWYGEELSEINNIVLPTIQKGATAVFHLYVIRTKRRDELQEYLKKQGIGTLIHYPIPPHLQECFRSSSYEKGDFPIAEEIAETCLSLPIYPGLAKSDIVFIAAMIISFFEGELK